MGALAWEQGPPKTHSVSRPFFDRGVRSSILILITGTRRISRLRVRLSATVGFIGQRWAQLCNGLCNDLERLYLSLV